MGRVGLLLILRMLQRLLYDKLGCNSIGVGKFEVFMNLSDSSFLESGELWDHQYEVLSFEL